MAEITNKSSLTGAPKLFDKLADSYDAWFDGEKGRLICEVERACIVPLLEGLPRPWLEVGVGTGRFAASLGVEEGVDPSVAALKYAANRGIRAREGEAESLPYPSAVFGAVLLVVTICFLNDPHKALRECRRVLLEDGAIIIGLVPKDSDWGELYAKKGSEGHPFYSSAKFYTLAETLQLASGAGLTLEEAGSCLFEKPGNLPAELEQPRAGLTKGAGFVAMKFRC